MKDSIIIRLAFVCVLGGVAVRLHPFGLSLAPAAALGVLLALAIIGCEIRLNRASLKRLIGASVGALTGILTAYIVTAQLRNSAFDPHTSAFVCLGATVVFAYIGLKVGADKGELLNLSALGGLFGNERARHAAKVLDTSVIIDGRIADIVETGFVDGELLVPQFVLRELQYIADSGEAAKRNRGRRGLEVLQRLQKRPDVNVRIVAEDFPQLREVDHKLIELCKLYECKLVTNDCNLAKLAELQQVVILNINQLASALKPAVLPGESMRVFILKEGKEFNQGVAYLDDGTMVVVDNARKMISKTVDIIVTSVLQTTAGKMIFGRWDERHGPLLSARPPAAHRRAEAEAGAPAAESDPAPSHHL